MANETTTSSLNKIERVYSDSISEAFTKKVVAINLISSEDLPVGTLVKSYKNEVDFAEAAAATVAEGGSFSTNTEMTNLQTNLTAAKSAISSKLTVEGVDFQIVSDQRVVEKQSSALARKADTEILALFPSFTNSLTCTANGTLDELYDAVFYVHEDTLRYDSVLNAVIGLKYANAIRKEVANSAASQFSLENRLSIMGQAGQAIVKPNGYLGSLPALNIYVTSGFSESGSDVVQGVFDPADAIEGIYGTSVNTWAIKVGQGNPSFVVELSSYYYHACTIRRATAGCKVLSNI
jgi:hypothetical protein